MGTKVGCLLFGVLLSLSAALLPTAQAADPVVVVVKVFPTPGREEELNARYLKQLEFLKQAEPRSSFRLHRSASPNDPTSFLWYEVYESQEALDHHLKVVMPNFQKTFGPTPKGLIARPSEHTNYRQIGN
ncbi:MAG TPA: antibiotic biosynthesis monooxygenase family protein [Burkholderiales bacterium]|nr:antibiotic biosynthesis monooxygenase family protein [Burkholderiales bacterium]